MSVENKSDNEIDPAIELLLKQLATGTVVLREVDYEALQQYVKVDNGRTQGIIIDDDSERHYMPLRPKPVDLSGRIMDLVEELGHLNYKVDPRAWDLLLIYAPPYRQLQKKIKKFRRAFKGLMKNDTI